MKHVPRPFGTTTLWTGRLAVAGFAVSLVLAACAGDDDDDNNGGSSSGGDGTGADGDDGGDDGSGDGGDGAGLSPECSALCDHTPNATDLQGDCAAVLLAEIGGYTFLEQSCVAFGDAFDDGNATVAQCVQCYLDAEVEAGDCEQAETTCFP